MRAVWMLEPEVLRHSIEAVDLQRRLYGVIHAAPTEVGITQRRVDEDRAGRQRAESSGKSKGISANRPRYAASLGM